MVVENIFRGKPIKITLESAPCFYHCPPHNSDIDIEQKLTISQSDKVTFTSKDTLCIWDREKDIITIPESPYIHTSKAYSSGRWMKTTLRKEFAGQFLNDIIAPFRKPLDTNTFVCDCGSWKLTAYNEDNEKFVFEGCLYRDCFSEAEELSYHIRRTLDMPSLYAFDGGSGTEKYIFASVAFDGNKKTYYYTTRDKTIAVGDKVLVPFGKDEFEGEVVEVSTYTELDVPFPLEKTKAIIKKLGDAHTIHAEVIEKLKQLTPNKYVNETYYQNAWKEIGADKYDYQKYVTTAPINCDIELRRLDNADYPLCCALMTMLFREDHFCDGKFDRRFRNGDVQKIIDRMIYLLEKEK